MQFSTEIDNKTMELLKVNQLRHPLGWTDKGEFTLLLRKGEKEYTFMLDAVPIEEAVGKRLMKLLSK